MQNLYLFFSNDAKIKTVTLIQKLFFTENWENEKLENDKNDHLKTNKKQLKCTI